MKMMVITVIAFMLFVFGLAWLEQTRAALPPAGIEQSDSEIPEMTCGYEIIARHVVMNRKTLEPIYVWQQYLLEKLPAPCLE